MKYSPLPSIDHLKSRLSYFPDSGLFFWKERSDIRPVRCQKRWNTIFANQQAGSIGLHGYWVIELDYVKYLSHRLAWLYVHGKAPAEEIDHINLDRSDVRIANLREATRSQNTQNSPGRSKKGMPKGVSRNGNRFQALISGKNGYEYLGTFDTIEVAQAVYAAAVKKHFGEFGRTA